LELVDPFGGLNDLNAQLIRTPQSPNRSFSDDPLRMLRAARLVAQLNFAIEPGTFAAIGEMKERLNIVSRERVNHELSRLLMAPRAVAGIEVLVNSGLIDYVIPEVQALKMQIDPAHHHKDVYAHTLKVLQNSLDRGADLPGRLAALLHDIAKPRTRKIDRTSGKVSFLHHDVIGAKMAREILGRLKYDHETIDSVSKLIFLHLRFYGYKDANWTDAAVRRYVVDAGAELERLHILVQSDCTTQNLARRYALEKAYHHLLWRIEEIQKTEQLSKVRPALDGREIMEILQLAPGPQVGKAYQFLLNLRFERGEISKAEARSALEQWFAAQTSD
jgi:poly(A) polymerase